MCKQDTHMLRLKTRFIIANSTEIEFYNNII